MRPDASHADMAIAVGSRAISSMVLLRLRRLPEEVVAVARAAAVLGDGAPSPPWPPSPGWPRRGPRRRWRHWPVPRSCKDEQPLAFVHPLVREAATATCRPPSASCVTSEAASVLRAAPSEEQVAAHLLARTPTRGRGHRRAIAGARPHGSGAGRLRERCDLPASSTRGVARRDRPAQCPARARTARGSAKAGGRESSSYSQDGGPRHWGRPPTGENLVTSVGAGFETPGPRGCEACAAVRSTCPAIRRTTWPGSPWNLQDVGLPGCGRLSRPPRRGRRRRRRRGRRRAAVAPQGTGHGAPPLEGRLRDSVLLRTSAMTELRRRPRAPDGAGRRRRAVGRPRRSSRSRTAWPHCTRPRRTWAWSATRSAEGSAGTPGGSDSSATRSRRPRLCSPTAPSCARPRTASRSCSGRCEAVPHRSASSCALEFDLFPIDTVVAGYLAWDWTEVERVLPAWVAWCAQAPGGGDHRRSGCSTCRPTTPAGRAARSPAGDDRRCGPGRRPHRHGDPGPLRALDPEIDTVDRVPAATLVRLHLDPEGPIPAYASSALVSALPDDAIAAIIDAAGPNSGTSLGGGRAAPARRRALAGPTRGGGALAFLEGSFLALGLGLDTDPAEWPQLRADAARLLAALEPWATGRAVPAHARRPDRLAEGALAGGARPALGGSPQPSTRTGSSCPRTPSPAELQPRS